MNAALVSTVAMDKLIISVDGKFLSQLLSFCPRDGDRGLWAKTRNRTRRRHRKGSRLFTFVALTSLQINPLGEWSLKSYCNLVGYSDNGSQDKTNGAGTDECKAEVVGRAAPVHRVLDDAEGKACYLLIHQDAKVVTKEGSSESQSEEATDHQQSAQHHEQNAGVEDVCSVHHLPPGMDLHRHCNAVAPIHIEQNDDNTQEVAGEVGTSKGSGQFARAMLPPSNHIPEKGVKNNCNNCMKKARFTKVDESHEFSYDL